MTKNNNIFKQTHAMQTKHEQGKRTTQEIRKHAHTYISLLRLSSLTKEQELHILLVPEGVWFSKVPLYYQHYYHHY